MPVLKSRSHKTTVRTPWITLVRSVTISITWWASGWPPTFTRPSRMNSVPGTYESNGLFTLGELGKLLALNGVARLQGSVAAGPAAPAGAAIVVAWLTPATGAPALI